MSDKKPAASLGAVVLVRTKEPIAGQCEHAAIVTKVCDGETVNAMMLPGEGLPYPVAGVPRRSNAPEGAVSWRWPPARV